MTTFQPRVFVSGGGLGIGCAIVQFLLEEYNARVICLTIAYGSEIEELLRRYDTRFVLVQGDVTSVSTSTWTSADEKEEDTDRCIQIARERFGGLDALVISAAIEPPPMRIIDMPFETYCRTMMINVCGPFLAIQRSLPLLRESTGRPDYLKPRILVLSSKADEGRYAGRSAYNTSKAALSRLIDNLVNEERESGVEILGVYPGFTQTDLAQGLIDRKYDNILWPEEAANYKRWIDGGKVEGPEWCGEACAKLAVGQAQGIVGKIARYCDHVPELKHGWWLENTD
jgi:NAD(P)-dependent dehydrogenase (short-subunit alcohol dehydrogenase family)